jgi:hypothetical protein
MNILVITHKMVGYRKLCSKGVNLGYQTKFIDRSRANMNIALEAILAKLPIGEIKATIHAHIQPLEKRLPDKRLWRVLEEMVLGILGGETPVITEIARQSSKEDGESWAVAKRMYRLLENKHIETSELYEGLYEVGCLNIAREKPGYLVAAVDPVNF